MWAVLESNQWTLPRQRKYLTNNINKKMLIRSRKSNVSEEIKKKAGENTGLSCQVAGAGLEPTTFGLWAQRAANCSIPQYIFNILFQKNFVAGAGLEPTIFELWAQRLLSPQARLHPAIYLYFKSKFLR